MADTVRTGSPLASDVHDGGMEWSTAVIPVVSVLVGGVLTFVTTSLSTRIRDRYEARFRDMLIREDRLLPVYLEFHVIIRACARLIEQHAMCGFMNEQPPTAAMRDAHEAVRQSWYRLSLLSTPEIVDGAEEVWDQFMRLSEELPVAGDSY